MLPVTETKVRPRAKRVDVIIHGSHFPIVLTPAEAIAYAEEIIKAAADANMVMGRKFQTHPRSRQTEEALGHAQNHDP